MIIKTGIISSGGVLRGPLKSFCLGFYTSGIIRNDVTGKIGMKITIGPRGIYIYYLIRWRGGESDVQNHPVEVQDADGIILGSGMINNLEASPGFWAYAILDQPVYCAPGQSYFLLSSEFAGGDSWIQHSGYINTPVATVNGALVNGSVVAPGEYCAGPLDMLYKFVR